MSAYTQEVRNQNCSYEETTHSELLRNRINDNVYKMDLSYENDIDVIFNVFFYLFIFDVSRSSSFGEGNNDS